jgi:hypothetical protein
VSEERTGNPEQPVGDASQGTSIRVPPFPQGGVADAALWIGLHGGTRPMKDSIAQSLVSGIAHDNNMGLATTFGDGRDPGQGPEGWIIATADRPRSLREQDGQGDPTYPRQGPQDRSIGQPIILCTRGCRAHDRAELIELLFREFEFAIGYPQPSDQRAQMKNGPSVTPGATVRAG